jgi:hypothetical protein
MSASNNTAQIVRRSFSSADGLKCLVFAQKATRQLGLQWRGTRPIGLMGKALPQLAQTTDLGARVGHD